jgi:hypothetical protein
VLGTIEQDGVRQAAKKHGLSELAASRIAPAADASLSQAGKAERAWRWAKETKSESISLNFIQEFGNTPFEVMASARLEILRRTQVTASSSTTKTEFGWAEEFLHLIS